MGSEISKKNSRNKSDEPTSVEIDEDWENQRIMYEVQYEELRNRYLHNQANTTNRSQLNQNNQPFNSPSTLLYPNLNVVNNNMQTTAVYSRPCTSFMPSSRNAPGTSYGTNTSGAPDSSYRPQPIPTAPPTPLNQTTKFQRQTSLHLSKQPSSNARNIAPKKSGQSIVDCVTCKYELFEQIYQCKNGHSSCKECRLEKAKCGVCCQVITDMRNITLEATLADMKPTTTTKNSSMMRCPYEGCNVFIKKDYTKHIKECRFGVLSCASMEVLGRCAWKGKLDQLVAHFNDFHEDHREADVNKEMSLSNITEDKKIVYLVNIGKFHFLVHVQINSSQETVSMMVQLIGTKNAASRWSYEIHIYTKQDQWRRHQYIGTCYSHAESVKEIIDSGDCALLSTKYAKTFLRTQQLFYKFYIHMDDIPKTRYRPN